MRFQHCRLNVLRVCLLATTAISPIAGFAEDLPVGGSVAAGIASITTPSASQMNINQGSQNAIINWQGFSVGEGARVDIAQPNANSALLNRVTGSATSSIHGQINANGQVLIVNPNGIQIGPNGVINTQSFGASTLGISDENFLNGNLEFEGSGASALVSNEGQIAVQQGGYAALLGGRVNNAGTIVAPLGSIGLGAGERVTLDFSGDGFLQVALPSTVEGEEALIENSGVLSANGGRVEISAATARNFARHAINLSGVAEARSVSGRSGAIVLGGGNGGIVTIDGGTLDVSADWDTGGDITVLGQHADLTFATLDASGALGGGSIRIGGDLAGGGDLQTAGELWVDGDTRILADAITSGNGGDIVLWSDDFTVFDGYISATGGSDFGDGGFAEVSGKANLSFSGMIDMSAENGDMGSVLLDPTNYSVVEIFDGYDPVDFPNLIINTTLQGLLASADYEISTSSDGSDDGNINISAPLVWDSSSILTLSADNDISITDSITATSGGLEIWTSGGTATATGGGDINVDRFRLGFGTWRQVAADLPDFTSTDFGFTHDSAEFIRATGGDGTAFSPYLLEDIYGVQGIASTTLLDGYFELTTTVNASVTSGWTTDDESFNSGFMPIGGQSVDAPFTGSLDGAGNTIDGLTSDFEVSGLFSFASDAAISDVSLTNVNMSGGGLVAGLVAQATDSTIDQVSVQGSLTGYYGAYVGGVAAEIFGTDIDQADADIDISHSGVTENFRLIGGLVGSASEVSSITRSYAVGSINVTGGVIVGEGGPPGEGEEIPHQDIGGLVGNLEVDASVFGSYADVAIDLSDHSSQRFNYVGGLVGHNTGSISDARAHGDTDILNILQVYAGGLVGLNEGSVDSAYATGFVRVLGSIWLHVGGLIGNNSGTVDETYSVGNVVGLPPDFVPPVEFRVGGLIGSAAFVDDITNSFWDTDTSFQSSSSGGTGLSTEVFQDPEAFLPIAESAGWSGSEEPYRLQWSAPSDGLYPKLYSIEPVFYASNLEFDAPYGLESYGESYGLNGGPEDYVFGPPSDLLDSPDEAWEEAFYAFQGDGNLDVGFYTVPGGVGTAISDAGVEYTVIYPDAPYEITPKAATLTSLDQTKVYGDEGFSLDLAAYTIDGLVAGDDPFIDMTSAGESVTATVGGGPYVIQFTEGVGLEFSNYDLTVVLGNLTVTPADLTVTALDQSKTYKESEFFLDSGAVTVVGLLNSDSVDDISLVSAGEAFEASAGTYDIVPTINSGTGLDNYNVSYVDGILTVDARLLTIGTQDQSKVYGDSSFSLDLDAFGFEGLHPDDSITSVTMTSAGEAVTAGVGPYAIVASDPVGTGLENYNISYEFGVLGVTPADLTISTDGYTKTYGEFFDLASVTVDVSGLLNSDSVSGVTRSSFGVPTTANVGVYDIGLSNATGNGLENYTVTYVPGELQVDAADLSITASDQSRVFNDFDFTLDTTAIEAVGLVNGDTVTSVTLDSLGLDDGASVGDYDLLPSAAVGSGLSNYSIVYLPGTLSVTGVPLTITAGNQTKTYGDGTFSLALDFSVDGLFEGDSVTSVSLSSLGADVTAIVGSYDIVASDPIGTGLDNYEISFVAGDLTVFPAELTITLNEQTKTYGETFEFGSGSFSVDGLLNSDTLTDLTLSSLGAPATANVGSYAITSSDPVGTGLGNYNIEIDNRALTVDPADLTITASNQGKSYGDPEFTLGTTGFTAVGLVNSDSVSNVVLNSIGEDVEATAGTYDIVASQAVGTGLSNYAIVYAPGTLTVSTALLTITANGQTKVYGDGGFSLDLTSFSVEGLNEGDSVSSVSLTSLGAIVTANVGDYVITPSDALGSGLDSYDISYEIGNLSVTPADLRVTANSDSKVYGTTYSFDGSSYEVAGLLNGDTVSDVALASEGTPGSAIVGAYGVTPSNASGSGLGNYLISYVPGTLTVDPASLTVTASDQGKTYGDQEFSLGSSAFTVVGLLNSDTVDAVALTSEGESIEAQSGTYDIFASEAGGSGLGNYNITYETGTLSVGDSILTISALGQSKTYADGEFSLDTSAFEVSGLVGEDQVTSVSLTSVGTAIDASVGSYLLDISNAIGSGLDSYTIVYADSLLEVVLAPLTISIANQSKTYGDLLELASTAFTTTGLAAFDSVTSVALASEGTDESANVGTYAITGSEPTGTNLENYDVSIVDGTLNVGQRGLTISAIDQTKVLGQAITYDGDEFEVAGLVNEDTVVSANIFSEGAGAEAAIEGSPYEIVVSEAEGSGLSNYDIDYQSANLTISAPQTNLPPSGGSGGGGGNGINPDDTKKTDPSGLPNPKDEITNLIDPEVTPGGGPSGSRPRGDTGSLEIILALSNDFEVAASACRQSNAVVDDYLGCIASALDKYADALEEATVDLPPELQEISAIIQEARQGVLDARNQARVRMQSATSSVERLAIETQAIAQARNSIQNAQGEIRKTIALLRAGEPEIFEVREEQINVVISALQTADTELARAVGL